jgi:Zn-dependent protease
MISTQSGSFRLFRVAGIQVFIHWSWFVYALYKFSNPQGGYGVPAWNAAEYLALFLIVLLHEFGHAFACRSTGGMADQIVLWPLGGIAFVQPPARPGAELWSIAAGPLVNVVLVPVLFALFWCGRHFGWFVENPDLGRFLASLSYINFALLIFNLLPVYPLDGGQILRSLLWFVIGRARSLQVASILGLVGLVGLAAFAFYRYPQQWIFTGFMAFFLGQQCVAGFRHARALQTLERMPRRPGFACPTCHRAPLEGPLWGCPRCGQGFDPFATAGICPHCQTSLPTTVCPDCHRSHPLSQWSASSPRSTGPVIDV